MAMASSDGPESASGSAPEQEETRREFLDHLVVGSLGLTGLGSAYIAMSFMKAPEAAVGPEVVDIGPEGGLPEGEAQVVAVGGTTVLVVNCGGDEGLIALSAICTHLGCIVEWDAEKGQIVCPCHAAIFDTQGNVVSGPAPAALPPYPVKVVSGSIVVGGA